MINVYVSSLQQPGAAPISVQRKTQRRIKWLSSKLAPHKVTEFLRQEHKGWGILISSSPTSNFQCLCSVELLTSVRAEQMSFLMDLLNHKNRLQNCI